MYLEEIVNYVNENGPLPLEEIEEFAQEQMIENVKQILMEAEVQGLLYRKEQIYST